MPERLHDELLEYLFVIRHECKNLGLRLFYGQVEAESTIIAFTWQENKLSPWTEFLAEAKHKGADLLIVTTRFSYEVPDWRGEFADLSRSQLEKQKQTARILKERERHLANFELTFVHDGRLYRFCKHAAWTFELDVPIGKMRIVHDTEDTVDEMIDRYIQDIETFPWRKSKWGECT